MKVLLQSNSLKKILASLSFLFLFSFNLSAQEGDYANGKKLFNANCAACHKLDKKLIGPALGGVTDRRENEWLQAWIKDNNALRASGDQDAIDIFNEYNGMVMTAYPQLTEQDINDILVYTNGEPEEAPATAAVTQEVDPKVAAGKKLYQVHCASCHKLDKKLIGPALGNVADRRSMEWLKAWIKDNNALRASGDQDAIDIFNEYNGMPMTAFPQLSDEDIEAIIAYTSVGDVAPVAAAAGEEVIAQPRHPIPWMTYVVILAIAGLVAWIYFVSNNGFLKISATIFVLILVGYIGLNALMDLGIDQDYQPIQPIAFSHKIHAGDNKIDCQYCHSTAKHSKHSGIPSVNVCMNCHKSIAEYNGPVTSERDKEFYDAEIQKIYDAIGWDPENLAYIEGYEQKPIQWVRIHNLPDFAYFNHAQHVTAGGIACQKCHGPVEEMEDMYQYSPLTMGWCIECHRETSVDLKGNDYYAKIHAQLADKYGVEKVTIAQIGGLECGKCHY
jgi:mono/diheme cytochrome c family protein